MDLRQHLTRLRIHTARKRQTPSAPFETVPNKGRSIGRPRSPASGVEALTLRKFPTGEPIFPTQVIPIVDMKRHRNDGSPQLSVLGKRTQPRLRRRTTTPSF